ncbi:MAG: hypothetical protein J6A96_00955 [Clostridia bacterium]|nr:hypothetical protein [Clostridia bacterium]
MISDEIQSIKYQFVRKEDMEKTFIITYIALSNRERQIKIKAPSKYRAKQIFYLEYPKYQILRIEEKTENV